MISGDSGGVGSLGLGLGDLDGGVGTRLRGVTRVEWPGETRVEWPGEKSRLRVALESSARGGGARESSEEQDRVSALEASAGDTSGTQLWGLGTDWGRVNTSSDKFSAGSAI